MKKLVNKCGCRKHSALFNRKLNICVMFAVPRGPEVRMNTMTLKVKLKEALRIIYIYFTQSTIL